MKSTHGGGVEGLVHVGVSRVGEFGTRGGGLLVWGEMFHNGNYLCPPPWRADGI